MIRLITRSVLRINSLPLYSFSSKPWKERQQSAEKVYITKAQKKTLQNLLNKIEDSEVNDKDQQFERRLKQILKYYRINNEAFYAQVYNLHRNL